MPAHLTVFAGFKEDSWLAWLLLTWKNVNLSHRSPKNEGRSKSGLNEWTYFGQECTTVKAYLKIRRHKRHFFHEQIVYCCSDAVDEHHRAGAVNISQSGLCMHTSNRSLSEGQEIIIKSTIPHISCSKKATIRWVTPIHNNIILVGVSFDTVEASHEAGIALRTWVSSATGSLPTPGRVRLGIRSDHVDAYGPMRRMRQCLLQINGRRLNKGETSLRSLRTVWGSHGQSEVPSFVYGQNSCNFFCFWK